MKIDPIAALDSRATGTAQLLLLQGDADFAARLTLGQILKGRVLLSYDGQRYAVEFDGQRKVVDSALPLTTGEIIHGRVIGLGEQVTLQRIRPPAASPEEPLQATPQRLPAGDDVGGAVAALFERYRARLDGAELGALQRLAARSPAPEQVALAALVLNKLGLQVTPEFVHAVHATLAKADAPGAFALPAQALALASTRAALDHDTSGLADWLSRALADVPEARLRETRAETDGFDANGDGAEQHDLARWILNAQTGGAVAHRVATLPLLLDGELVELDVALFAQTGDAPREQAAQTGDAPREPAEGIRHRELVFALSTETLGRVEIRALLANGHLKLRVAASSATAQRLAEHADALADGLQRIGWQVDEQRYESRVEGERSGVLASVVEHLISPGSVSRLV